MRTPTFGRPAVTISGTNDSLRKQQSKRSGPEDIHQRLVCVRYRRGNRCESALLCNVDDERVPVRPLFGLEDLPDGLLVQRIGAQPVDRLGGKRDRAASLKNACCLGERGLRCSRVEI